MNQRQIKLCPVVVFTFVFLILAHPSIESSLKNLGLPLILRDEYMQIIAFSLSFACAVLFFARRRFDAFGLVALSFFAWIGIATSVNGGSAQTLLMTWAPLLATLYLVGAFWDKCLRELLTGMLCACLIYLLLNLFIMVQTGPLLPNSQTFLFFGIRTITFRIALPAILCSLLLDSMANVAVSLRTVALYALSLLEVIVGYCATTLCTLILIGVATFLLRSRKVRRVLNSFTYLVTDIVIFASIVVARIQGAFSWLIEGVLHKTLTFSGRVPIWDATFSLLDGSHLLFGYGASYLWNAIYANGQWIMHAHNDILDLAMTGGVPLVLLMIAMQVMVATSLFKNRETKEAAIVALGIFAFMVIGIFEVANCVGYFFFLALGYYVFKSQRGIVEAKLVKDRASTFAEHSETATLLAKPPKRKESGDAPSQRTSPETASKSHLF